MVRKVALFYVIATPFDVWLQTRKLESHNYTYIRSSNIIMFESCKENSVPHNWKRKKY